MNTCISCKGKGMCGRPVCPIYARFKAQVKVKPKFDYVGSAPSILIGSTNYPSISAGPLMTADNDNPSEWINAGLSIDDIVTIRAQTIRGFSKKERYIDSLQDIALSSIPLNVETVFNKPISYDLKFDGMVTPVGMTGQITSFGLMDTPKINRAVDKVVSDTDLKAVSACNSLNNRGIDTYKIISLMSAGLLGEERNRRLVPTRWAITAVDDTVGKNLKQEIFKFPSYENITVFSAESYANNIAIILMPGDWTFEMTEIWATGSLWAGKNESVTVDREGRIKSDYSPITGAYYSARLAVLEYLKNIRRNARVIVVRYVTSDYWAPLGTWVIREVTRKAMAYPPVNCPSLDVAAAVVSERLGMSRWMKSSSLLHEVKTQKTLEDFF